MRRYIKAHFHLGRAFANQGNYAKAIEILEKVLEFNPRFVNAYFELGHIYEKQYLMDKAITQYELALRLEPDYKEANFHLGILYKNLGKLDAALNYLNKTVELDSSEGDAYYYMGLIYLNRGEHDRAIEMFGKSLKIMPEHSFAHYSLGLAYYQMERLDDAVEEYKKALALNPGDTQAHNALGMAFLKAEDFDDAVEHFNNVLKINPRDCYAHYYLGAVSFRTHHYSEAIEEFHKAVETGPSDVYRSFTSGAHLLRERQFEEAVAEFQNAATHTPASESDLSLFATLQLLSTTALEQAKQNAVYHRRYDEVSSFTSGFARVISHIVDERSPESFNHSFRVSEISGVIARQSGLSDREIREVRMAGLLHDLGKLKIPRKILRTPPTRLDKEDLKILYSHPIEGYELLKDIAGFENIANIVLCHHERYDGRGFPRRLRGDSIPMGAQIVSAADYWDKLINQKKLSPAAALDHLLGLRYKSYSSEIINIFLSVVDDLLLI